MLHEGTPPLDRFVQAQHFAPPPRRNHNTPPRVALVHDYLSQYGGAERVLEEFHEIWPEAPVFTAIFDPKRMPAHFSDWDIRTSWLDRIPFARTKHQALLPLLPTAFEQMDLSDYDLVVSSSSGFAHGVHTGPETCHVCYCHSPPRFLWDYHNYARRESLGWPVRGAVEVNLAKLRTWDRIAAERADAWIGTSRIVQARIDKVYRRDSDIIPPPVKIRRFEVAAPHAEGAHFLMLMRLVGWKRPDIVVKACTQRGLPLVVAGDGREEANLRRIAGPTIRFVGRVNDVQMRDLYRDAKALILPSEEDFGITPLESMAAGRPVIAFGKGGVLDTVVDGVTGLFFAEQTAESLGAALQRFDPSAFSSARIRKHVEQFDSAVFARRIQTFASSALKRHRIQYAL